MRRDMDRVIIERERYGGMPKKGRIREHARVTSEHAPKRESIRRYSKELTDVLNPLVGFLTKNVGRRWDTINSEICGVLSVSSASQSHVMDHLDDMVVKDVYYREVRGRKYPYDSKDSPLVVYSGRRYYQGFYVCPNTGILKLVPESQPKNRRYDRPKKYTEVDGRVFKKIDGVWYELTTSELPPPKVKSARVAIGKSFMFTNRQVVFVDDLMLGLINRDSFRLTEEYGPNRFCTHKQQVNSKTIKKLGLQ